MLSGGGALSANPDKAFTAFASMFGQLVSFRTSIETSVRTYKDLPESPNKDSEYAANLYTAARGRYMLFLVAACTGTDKNTRTDSVVRAALDASLATLRWTDFVAQTGQQPLKAVQDARPPFLEMALTLMHLGHLGAKDETLQSLCVDAAWPEWAAFK
jgi:hypothetical protein